MAPFATVDDVILLWRALSPDEISRAGALLEIVSDDLRVKAKKQGKDLDKMSAEDPAYKNVVRSVVVDIIARTLMTATDGEPMVTRSESALGYSVSGTYLVPGGGLFIKKDELARLGLRNQKYGVLEFYAYRDPDLFDH